MVTRHASWNILNAVLGAIAAVVTAVTGLYLALKSDPSPGVTPSVSRAPASTELFKGTAYDRTPWLGIELRQNNQSVQLRSINDAWDQFEATLDSGSFEVTVTRNADDPSIGVLAWHDDSIFDCVHGDKFFIPGTGIAGGKFAVPIMYLNKEGFNYYDTQRMKRLEENKYSMFISTIGSGELELPLVRFSGPIYLVIFRVPDSSEMVVSRHDFERFILRRR
jgi:hypothetical protein